MIINKIFFFFISFYRYTVHSFIILRDPENIRIKSSSMSGIATDILTNTTINIALQADFDPKGKNDNPFSHVLTSIEAAYFWLSGNFVQRDTFDFWAVDVFTIIASLFLVIILQNMLIAFMGYVFSLKKYITRITQQNTVNPQTLPTLPFDLILNLFLYLLFKNT